MADDKVLYIRDIIQRSDIPRELIPVFEKLRVEAFTTAQKVYDDRTVGYNIDHPPYEEMVYGPLSLVSEIFKRARRLAALLSPIRTEPLRGADMNRMIDLCVDLINYLSWTYALLILASGYEGHLNSDDSNDYVGLRGGNQ
jgi:hypothetical protein